MMRARHSVLVVAYHFPPLGGPGVQRSLGFVRYLADFGWSPTVVSVPLGDGVGAGGRVDQTLADAVPGGVEIVRGSTREPGPQRPWRRRWHRWSRIPTPGARWWIASAVESGSRVGGVNLVFASMAPYESAPAAQALAVLHGVPWVADLRDPWALDEMQVRPSRVHLMLERRAMRRGLAGAAAIVANTPEAAREIRESFPSLGSKRIVAITNGFDPVDFAAAAPPVDPTAFRIVFTGGADSALGRRYSRQRVLRRVIGGATKAVDLLPRSYYFLGAAVEHALKLRPDLRDLLRVDIVGSVGDQDAEELARHAHVTLHGYLPHGQAVRIMRSADLLYLPLHGLEPGFKANSVPGKMYEYVASGRPILAAVPPGDARDIAASLPQVHVVEPGDVAAIADVIIQLADAKRSGAVPPRIDPAAAERFDRRVLTATLAQLFDEVVGGRATEGRVAGE